MKDPKDRFEGDAGDQGWIDRVSAHYAPTPLTPARRAALDQDLRERIAEPQRPQLWIPTLATGLAALLAWAVLWPSPAPMANADASSWSYEVLLSSDVGPMDDAEDSYLPEDYEIIESAFLGG